MRKIKLIIYEKFNGKRSLKETFLSTFHKKAGAEYYMNLKPGIGIDEIKLGITQTDLIQILGEPDKIKQIEFIDEIRLIYNELMVTFCFNPNEENKLSTIEISNPELYLWENKLIGMDRASIVELLCQHGVTNIESEDYGHFESLDICDIGIELRIEFDIVQEVKISFRFDENDNIIWPK